MKHFLPLLVQLPGSVLIFFFLAEVFDFHFVKKPYQLRRWLHSLLGEFALLKFDLTLRKHGQVLISGRSWRELQSNLVGGILRSIRVLGQ